MFFKPLPVFFSPPPSHVHRFDSQMREMRNAMLRGGHAWDDTKAALAEAYPDSERERLVALDKEALRKWHEDR